MAFPRARSATSFWGGGWRQGISEVQVRPIDRNSIQAELDNRLGQELYLHLETTTGSYTKLGPEKKNPVIAFVRNARISYARGTVTGSGPYRVGLKLDEGWVYADGLTDYDVNERGELLLAGLDCEGQLTMALQLSATPFREGQTDAE
jgi:hypothetical protein